MIRRHVLGTRPAGPAECRIDEVASSRASGRGSSRAGGRLAGSLYVLCGSLVAVLNPSLPAPPGTNRLGIEAVVLVAIAFGVLCWFLPWERWRASASLWVIPPAFLFLDLTNHFDGADGYRYGLFFLVAFAWIGLSHPLGTSVRFSPLMALAYLGPLWWKGDASASAFASLAYALPACVVVGETVAWVSNRWHQSELAVRASEARFRSLVQHAADVVTVIDRDGVITYDSPAIGPMLGYGPSDRVGTRASDYVHPEDHEGVAALRKAVAEGPDGLARSELRLRHADGSWRWCQFAVRNLLDDPFVAGVVANISDVTERHEYEEMRRLLAGIVESSGDAIIGEDVEGGITTWNSAAEAMYGYRADEVIGRHVSLLAPPDRLQEVAAIQRELRAGGRIERLETVRARKDGTALDVSLTVSPTYDASGAVIGASAIARDITRQKRYEAALKDSAASFRLLFDSNPQPMWVYDLDTLMFLEVNEAAVERYGYSRAEFLTMNITDIRPSEDVPALLADIAARRNELQHAGSWRHRLRSGRIIDAEITSHKLQFSGRSAALVSAADVTERRQYEAALAYHANHDELSGLANRRLLRLRAEEAIAAADQSGSVAALLLVDLDRFNEINDALGAEAGDHVLQTVARMLADLVPSTDTVARMGSDEFAILLAPAPKPSNAHEVATKIITRLADPIQVDGITLSVQASVGAALYPDHGADIAQLLQRADMALARAKRSLIRYEVFDPSFDVSSADRLALLAELRQAIDSGELRLYYQPKADLRTQRVLGVEALVRWEHPERGLLLPDQFVPLAERTGIIRPLTSFVLAEAISQLAVWRGAGLDLTMSVNLAPANLTDLDLPVEIALLLRLNDVPAGALQLEITESAAMSDLAHTGEVVLALRRLGVELSIDDFGTGHSSLTKLRALPMTEIKVDKSFVLSMSAVRDDATIVRSTIELGHNLGLRVVAEGVETQEVANALLALGCDVGQGYWLARPAPADTVTEWLRLRNAAVDQAGAARPRLA